MRILFSTTTLVVALSMCACGSDKTSAGPSSAARGGAVASGGAGSSGKVVCAKETCALPEGTTGELCCADAFSGGCGVKSNGACLVFPKADPRCPAPDFTNFMLPPGVSPPDGGSMFFTACCGANNQCGVDYGTGCMSIASLCAVLPKYLTSTIRPATCDGTPMELPPNCGTDNNIMIPGLAGSKG